MAEPERVSSEPGNKVLTLNSDGYLVEVEEGTLSVEPPPPPPKRKKQARRFVRKDRSSRPNKAIRGKKNPFAIAMAEIPGLLEWHNAKLTETRYLSPVKQGAPIGQTDGFTKRQAEIRWKKATKLARQDMTEIKKKIDLTEAAEEALESVLTVMRGPVSTKDQLAAASKVLEYTMSKPIAKQEVTVNAAEAWLASLKEEDEEE